MKTKILIIFFFVSFTLFAAHGKIDKSKEAQARILLNNQPIEFIENKGQFTTTEGKPADNVLFKASVNGCDIYITDKGLSYVFYKIEEKEDKETDPNSTKSTHVLLPSPHRRGAGGEVNDTNRKVFYYRMDMDLVGATILKENIIKEEESKQGHYNYFYPHCPEGIYDVKAYSKITIKNIYKGIDWIVYANSNNKEQPIKYDFVINPIADYKDIKIKYINADSINLIENATKLKIQSIAGTLVEGNIYSYLNNNKEEGIQSKYILSNDSIISFDIANYDKTQTLIIDPIVWATYYFGYTLNNNYVLEFNSITTDKLNNIYIIGTVSYSNFPTFQLSGAYWNTTGNMFILKFNSKSVRLWATYYGGNAKVTNIFLLPIHFLHFFELK